MKYSMDYLKQYIEMDLRQLIKCLIGYLMEYCIVETNWIKIVYKKYRSKLNGNELKQK